MSSTGAPSRRSDISNSQCPLSTPCRRGSGTASQGFAADRLQRPLLRRSRFQRRLKPGDVLVNNARVFSHAAIEDITEEQFHQMFNINVLGTIFVTQQAVKHFGDQGGSIINIGSMFSRRFKAGAAVSTATKNALNGITGVFAVELASRKIRVNAILQGFVDTEGSRAFGVMGTEWEKQ